MPLLIPEFTGINCNGIGTEKAGNRERGAGSGERGALIIVKQIVNLFQDKTDELDLATAKKDKNIVAMKEKPITKEFLNEFKTSINSSLL